jgi:site-specific recombinase XerD
MSGIPQSTTLADEFNLYLATDSAQKSPRSAKADAYFLGVALHFLNNVRKVLHVEQVRLEDLQLFQLWLAKEQILPSGSIKEPWSDTTTEYYCRVLKKFFRKMHATDRIAKDPCKLWKVPRGTAEARRPMTITEFEAIHEAAPDWFKPILMFIRLTGSRGASVQTLTWADVHFEEKTLILRSRKGGLRQMKLIPIPMYPALYEFLHEELVKVADDERPPRATDPVFWSEYGLPVTAQQISSEGSRLIKLCGFRGKVVLYGLRHALATEMTAAGIPLEITRQAMGHSSITQTSHYAKGIASAAVSEAFGSIRGKKNE